SIDQWWLHCTPTSGTNAGVLTISVNPAGLSPGNYSGTVTITASQASNSPQTVKVNLKVINASQDREPFGSFSTPVDGSFVCSSIPVTGWALDDLEVQSVRIYRQIGNGHAFIGETVFVEGARPDVEAAYPGYPMNHTAGWGYMLLTNFLPNGTQVIYAVAADSAGHQVTLGSGTITIDNTKAVKPFGAIDTPTQGGSASGRHFQNQGWVLTPLPNKIPVNGSTINVYVDGQYIGHPTYNIYRQDIAAYFPGYANSSGAMAYLEFDTTQYSNGVHSIQWVVTDNAGNTDGIGSRYFTVQNSGSQQRAAGNSAKAGPFHMPYHIPHIPLDRSRPIGIKKGYNPHMKPRLIYADNSGNVTVKIKQLERLEIHFFDPGESGLNVEHRMLNISALPVGSTLDMERGIFYWHAGPGFLGRYEFVFVIRDKSGRAYRINVVVKIEP
ncbi:MAG: BACON domain-containing protein, partial [Candidatus Aminicenantes bacterium]